MSQENSVELKTVDNAYEKILHFSPDDYTLIREAPGNPGCGIEGIFAGENYLLLWDIDWVYIFDIHNYGKLGKIQLKVSPRDVVENQKTIYVLGKRNILYVYDTFQSFKRYEFVSEFKSVADYKGYIAQHNLDNLSRPLPKPRIRPDKSASTLSKKQQEANRKLEKRILHRERMQYYATQGGEKSWRYAKIWSLHVHQGGVYLNVDNNYWNFDQDFIKEEDDILSMDDNNYFMVPIQEAFERKEAVFCNGFLIRGHSYNNTKGMIFYITTEDLYSHNISKNKFYIKENVETGKLRCTKFRALLDSWLLLDTYWLTKSYRKVFILKLNINTNYTEKFELPNWPSLDFVTNSRTYYTYSNNFIYAIAYNSDASFDVLKVEVTTH